MIISECRECHQLFFTTSGRKHYCNQKHYRTYKICGELVYIKPDTFNDPHNVCTNPKCVSAWRAKRNIEIYGTPDPGNSPENVEKRRQTCLSRYGVDNPAKCKDFRQKASATFRANYGVDWVSQNPDIIKKQQTTLKEHYGDDLSEVVNRRRAYFLEHYEVTNGIQLDATKEQARMTRMERYGQYHAPATLEGVHTWAKVPGRSAEVAEHRKQTILASGGYGQSVQK